MLGCCMPARYYTYNNILYLMLNKLPCAGIPISAKLDLSDPEPREAMMTSPSLLLHTSARHCKALVMKNVRAVGLKSLA